MLVHIFQRQNKLLPQMASPHMLVTGQVERG